MRKYFRRYIDEFNTFILVMISLIYFPLNPEVSSETLIILVISCIGKF